MNTAYKHDIEDDYYLSIRKLTEDLAKPLSEADAQIQSMPDASPAKWHLAHTTWFFETFLLCKYLSGYQRKEEAFNYLFNSYYNGIGEQYTRARRGMISRPSLKEVIEYRRHIDENILTLINSNPDPEILYLVELGLNHEQQHQELFLTDIKHALYQNPLCPAYHQRKVLEKSKPVPVQWVQFNEGVYEIGYNGKAFCFDNETPTHKVYLNDFKIASRPVNNGEYIEFINDGGYRRPELWLSDAWSYINQHTITQPLYWRKIDKLWFQFTLAGMEPVNLSAPVTHISLHEASAFANWADKRLPTEAEWEVAANSVNNQGYLLHLDTLHPQAVNETGLQQLIGDVWEWTSSSYNAYPGFTPYAGVVGEYNGKFMLNQYVLRGGSCATPATHIRKTYRNFFYSHQAWQFTGIRLAD